MKNLKKIFLISLSQILLITTISFADEISYKDKPVSIDSENLSIDQITKLVTFSGKVRATQEDIQITSDKMIADYNSNNKISKIDILNNVVITRESQIIKGDKAVYYIKDSKIILEGNVMLIKDDNILKGKYLTYDLNNNEASMQGSSKDVNNKMERVKAVFTTKE